MGDSLESSIERSIELGWLFICHLWSFIRHAVFADVEGPSEGLIHALGTLWPSVNVDGA